MGAAAIDLAATYTEVDPNSRISASTVTATFAGIARNEDAYLYKDWGAGYFGDFVHDFETTGTTWANGSKLVVWGLSNSLASKASWAAGLYLQLGATSTTAGTYTLGEIGGSTSVGASIAKAIMYWRIERNGTTLTAKRATSAANRTAKTWAETLTITVATTTYQYQYAGSSVNDTDATTVTQTTANYKGTKMTSAGTPFDTVYMAGASSGNWDAGATWGNAGSSKGTDYPGNASDAVKIDIGNTVTYNVSESNALADVDVYGTLTFSTSVNTLLALGNNNITVKNGGTLNIGTNGSPIGAAYTAEVRFGTTGDASKGIFVDTGGTISIVGSDVTGGTFFTYLTANWTSGQTFTVYGDVTTKWAIGQKLLVHKFNTSYQSGVECNEYTINGLALNGSNTDITISEAAPGVTFRAGGLVGHLTRNVTITKTSATTTIGSGNSNRPIFQIQSTTWATPLTHLKHAVFIGLFSIQCSTNGRIDATGIVTRNCRHPFGTTSYKIQDCIITNCLFTSCDVSLSYIVGNKFTNCVVICNVATIQNIFGCIFDSCYFVNIRSYLFAAVAENLFKNCDFVGFDSIIAASTIEKISFFNCNFGKYGHNVNTSTYNNEFYAITNGDSSYFNNCIFGHDPPQVHSSFWNYALGVNHRMDNYNGVSGRSYSWNQWYATASNGTVVRSGGASKSLEVYHFDICQGWRGLITPIIEWVEWDVPASSQTRTVYIRGGTGGAENWSTFPTADQLFLEAEYCDEAGTNHVAFAISDDVLTDNTTWTAFSVTFVPGKVDRVVYRLRVGVQNITGVKLYVDPQLNAA